MASELKPETLRKKQRSMESLPDFLARMTLVWQDRQRRLDEAAAKHLAAVQRSQDKVKLADPEGFRRKRLDAVKRYAQRHPERVRETRRRSAKSVVPSDAKRAKRPEGYPKVQPSPRRSAAVVQPLAVVPQDDLSRAWAGFAGQSDSRLDDSASPAL